MKVYVLSYSWWSEVNKCYDTLILGVFSSVEKAEDYKKAYKYDSSRQNFDIDFDIYEFCIDDPSKMTMKG